jgi:hypothetical protein
MVGHGLDTCCSSRLEECLCVNPWNQWVCEDRIHVLRPDQEVIHSKLTMLDSLPYQYVAQDYCVYVCEPQTLRQSYAMTACDVTVRRLWCYTRRRAYLQLRLGFVRLSREVRVFNF